MHIPTLDALKKTVAMWLIDCFGFKLSVDCDERNQRFLEEALELVQAQGLSREKAHQLVDYVYNRPMGEPSQEVAGTLIALTALSIAADIDMQAAIEKEMARVTTPEIMAKIRIKQAEKPRFKDTEAV